MFLIISRKRRIELRRFAYVIGSGVATLLLASPAFAQFGGPRWVGLLFDKPDHALAVLSAIEWLFAWAADVRRTRHIGDFTQWKEHDQFETEFARLLRDLKA